MLFKNRKSDILNLALILVLLGGIFGAQRVEPVDAASLDEINMLRSVSQTNSAFPTVVTTTPQQGDVLLSGLSSISVQFSANMLADGTTFAVNRNPIIFWWKMASMTNFRRVRVQPNAAEMIPKSSSIVWHITRGRLPVRLPLIMELH